MPNKELVVEVESRGDVGILRMQGEVDGTSSPTFESRLEELLHAGRRKIIVVLAGVSFMSSAGWGVLLGNMNTVKARGGTIVVAGMTGDVKHVYDVLGVAPILKSFGTEAEAKASVTR